MNYPIWHPFTQMQLEKSPLLIERAEKEFLYTADGKKIIDGVSSWWTNIHGHSHKDIVKAVNEQAQKLEQVIFAGFTHQPALDIAVKLLALSKNNYSKVFFSDDGSTAVEVALKMAIQYHYHLYLDSASSTPKRKKIIAFTNAYHGDTFGAMSAAGSNVFTAAFSDYFFEVVHVMPPYFGEEQKALEQFSSAIEEDCVAFIYEPLVQGAGGMLMHNPETLKQMIRLAKQKNIVPIADEVMTGFGRTGSMFASQEVGECPHIMALSKGLTAGFMPMSVTLVHQKIYDAFLSEKKERAFFHGHSFTANPLACAAANASLKIFEQENTMQKIQEISLSHENFLKTLKNFPIVKNARQQGTILAFDIIEDDNDYLSSSRDFFYNYFLQNGVLLRPLGNTIYILPPYCISRESLDTIYALIIDALNKFSQET